MDPPEKCEIISKLTVKTSEWHHWRPSDAFIVNFKPIPQIVLVFPLLTWDKKISPGCEYTYKLSSILAINFPFAVLVKYCSMKRNFWYLGQFWELQGIYYLLRTLLKHFFIELVGHSVWYRLTHFTPMSRFFGFINFSCRQMV